MDEEYRKKLQRFREILEEKFLKSGKLKDLTHQDMELDEDLEEDLIDLKAYLKENNSFENSIDRISAEKIIHDSQKASLDIDGGYPLWDEVSFVINGEEYTVIAYGASNENEGEDALFGIIFVKEDEESKKLREWGRYKAERDFARFNKYLDEVKKGLREPNGKDEFGNVPYICERCKKEHATVYSSRGNLCKKCDDELGI